jgi:hypothetical protein
MYVPGTGKSYCQLLGDLLNEPQRDDRGVRTAIYRLATF